MDKNKSIHEKHRSRMKDIYLENGLEAFSDIEKLEFILYFAISRKDTNPIAHRLLDEFKTFDKVLEAPVRSLQEIEGIGEHAAIFLNMLLKISSSYGKSKNTTTITGTNSAKEYCKNLFRGKSVEEFFIICLASNNRVVACKLIESGTISEVPVDIRKLTNVIVQNNTERVIIAHNHPFGVPRPSDEDIAFTSKILVSCILNDVEVLDHIIAAKDTAFSFEESLLLKELKRDAIRKLPYDKEAMSKFGQQSSNYKIG